ncbi:flagellar basal body P-ring protein FlgI [Pleionea sediminis]|uniref:flagellar basal body P-ring protein FlgI n=1 Tax=Pleionea sediminis TaxID=2569479 RepID=UPI001186E247|nr:flagellar basal body P-ring protein FlgI [Pleionea sediminis]
MKYFNLNKSILVCLILVVTTANGGVRLKELGRFDGIRDNQLVGYGLVVGLAGTGDSSRNKTTVQSIANTVKNFGITIDSKDVRSRNVAAVLVTGTLPPFSEKGDTIDIKVSSIGDARSLAGGTLIMTPLRAPNNEIYALAQGPLSVGGYAFDSFDSVVQKNHPTVGIVNDGGLIERSTRDSFLKHNQMQFILNEPDFETVSKISESINGKLRGVRAEPLHAGKVNIHFSNLSMSEKFKLISAVENIEVIPQIKARVVINERTGTIVAGGQVKISDVTISHGDLKLVVNTKYQVSQPFFIGRANNGVNTQVIPDTEIEVKEKIASSVDVENGANVSKLVESLQSLEVSTRDIIIILQSIKRAGALHAELIVE